MWLTHFWHSWSQFFIFAWDVTAGGILRTGVLICLVDNKSALVQAMAWHWKGDKAFTEPLMTQFTDIYLSPGLWLNSFWPSDAVWWYRSGSTLVQVMVCWLMAPSHCLGKFWFIMCEVHWQSLEWGPFCKRYLSHQLLKLAWKLPKIFSNFWGHWVKGKTHRISAVQNINFRCPYISKFGTDYTNYIHVLCAKISNCLDLRAKSS